MNHSVCATKWQCELAVKEIMGHGGWEKTEWDVHRDSETEQVVPVICALRGGKIFSVSGEELQKILDEFFPLETEGSSFEAFRKSLEEHRRAEAEHKAKWGDRLQHL